MPHVESHLHGTPSWCDKSTADLDATKAFYGSLFGWEFHTAPEPEAGGYTMALRDGRAAAAVMPLSAEQLDQGMPPVWSMYITVDDVDAMPAKVEAAGGTVMAPPFDVLTAGRMMVAFDKGGAGICFWEARDNIGSEIVNETGAFTWAELYTGDPAADTTFYAEALGHEVTTADMGGPVEMTFLKRGDADVATVLPLMAEGMPPHWVPYFAVDDCEAAMAQIAEMGGQVHMGPVDIPPGRFAVAADPEGATFAVIRLNPMG